MPKANSSPEKSNEDASQDNDLLFKGKIAFIITPISTEISEIRMKSYGVISAIISPVLSELGFKVIEPLQIDNPGSITNQIINQLIDADLVVANLTGLNPNVMYELAVRHGANLPVVQIAEETTVLPFDLYTERTIKYHDSMAQVESLKPKFKNAVISAMQAEEQDNPIQAI